MDTRAQRKCKWWHNNYWPWINDDTCIDKMTKGSGIFQELARRKPPECQSSTSMTLLALHWRRHRDAKRTEPMPCIVEAVVGSKLRRNRCKQREATTLMTFAPVKTLQPTLPQPRVKDRRAVGDDNETDYHKEVWHRCCSTSTPTTSPYTPTLAASSTQTTCASRVAPLNVKTTLNVKTAKCEKPNNR